MKPATASAFATNFSGYARQIPTEPPKLLELAEVVNKFVQAATFLARRPHVGRDQADAGASTSALPFNLESTLLRLTGLAVGPVTTSQFFASQWEIEQLPGRTALIEFENRLALTRARLASFLDLPHGWDDEDSQPGNRAHCEAAMSFLEKLPIDAHVPSAMIGNDGSLGLFWQLRWLHAEVEFIDGHVFSLYLREWDSGVPSVLIPEIGLRDVSDEWFRSRLGRIFEHEIAAPACA